MCWLFLAANWVGFRTTMKTNVYVYVCGGILIKWIKVGRWTWNEGRTILSAGVLGEHKEESALS